MYAPIIHLLSCRRIIVFQNLFSLNIIFKFGEKGSVRDYANDTPLEDELKKEEEFHL